MDRILRDKKAIIVFLLPGLLVFTFVVLIPVGWSLVYSLYEGVVGIQLDFTGLHNYTLLFRDPQFIRSMIITLKYALVVTSSQMILGLLFAFLFAYGVKYKTVVRTICFLPVVLPVVAVGQLFSKMYAIAPMYGLINSLLDLLGLGAYCKAWIGTTQTATGRAVCTRHLDDCRFLRHHLLRGHCRYPWRFGRGGKNRRRNRHTNRLAHYSPPFTPGNCHRAHL